MTAWTQQQDELTRLRKQVRDLESENEVLRDEVANLSYDLETLERENFHLSAWMGCENE